MNKWGAVAGVNNIQALGYGDIPHKLLVRRNCLVSFRHHHRKVADFGIIFPSAYTEAASWPVPSCPRYVVVRDAESSYELG